jgi:hypothetical protein
VDAAARFAWVPYSQMARVGHPQDTQEGGVPFEVPFPAQGKQGKKAIKEGKPESQPFETQGEQDAGATKWIKYKGLPMLGQPLVACLLLQD